MNTILFVDTETGGIDPQTTSLLSVGVVLWQDGVIKDGIEFFVKSDIYNVTPEAMGVNHIDLSSIYVNAKTEDQIICEFKDFLLKNGYEYNGGTMTMGGHNTSFDMSYIRKHLPKLGDMFSHRIVDTSGILKFLYHAGKLPKDISKMGDALDYFKIGDPAKRHGALNDALDTANIYNELLKMA